MIPQGLFVTKGGPMMAAADKLIVTVRGAGGHGSSPHRANDPIPAACEMVTALQTMVTRGFDVFDPVVVTVGSFHAGTADNIIPEEARFEATIRSFSAAAHARIQERAVTLVKGIAAAHGLEVDADYDVNYPVTVNNPTEADFVARPSARCTASTGSSRLPSRSPARRTSPSSATRCRRRSWRSARARRTPIRARPPKPRPGGVFDNAVLPDGAALYAALAIARLDQLAAQKG